jgi:hypothetical protein
VDRLEQRLRVGDVDLIAGQDSGEGVEVQVPTRGGGGAGVGGAVLGWGPGDGAGEVEEGVVAVGVELPR